MSLQILSQKDLFSKYSGQGGGRQRQVSGEDGGDGAGRYPALHHGITTDGETGPLLEKHSAPEVSIPMKNW